MSRVDRASPIQPAGTFSRRDLLRGGMGSIPLLGLASSGIAATGAEKGRSRSCILITLVGGPSQLDTWDMKPDAPSNVRGPFRPIATNVPGLAISELFPRMTRVMDRVALVRGLHHEAPPVHDAGHQLLGTGRYYGRLSSSPHVGSVVSRILDPGSRALPPVLLPGPIGMTGGNLHHGQDAAHLGPAFDSITPDRSGATPGPAREAINLGGEPESIASLYGPTDFGRDCLRARRLVERGARFVTVNMGQTVFDAPSWDAHGSAPFSTFADYRDTVGPIFDRAYSGLLLDLDRLGLLDETLVVAVGEFGRTPRINASGGRDHHPGCWTGLFAGGPVRGGQAVGSSDAVGSEPIDRPTTPADVVATIYQALGIDPRASLPGPDGELVPLVDPGARPISELG